MNRRGFFSAIASAVAAGIVIPRESIIVATPALVLRVPMRWTFYQGAYYKTDEETGIHVRLFPDPAQRMDIQAEWLSPVETITPAEFARRYPPKSAP